MKVMIPKIVGLTDIFQPDRMKDEGVDAVIPKVCSSQVRYAFE